MQRHREEAQTAAVHRRMKDAARLAHLQAMLQRQQVILVLTCQLFFFSKINIHLHIYSNITKTLKRTFNCGMHGENPWYHGLKKEYEKGGYDTCHTAVFLFLINQHDFRQYCRGLPSLTTHNATCCNAFVAFCSVPK